MVRFAQSAGTQAMAPPLGSGRALATGSWRMNLRLVSSGNDRALAIRDHHVPLVRGGRLEVQRGPVRLTTLQTGPWDLRHWTPFNDLTSGEAFPPGYRHALERQHTRPSLPYGLEVWRDGVKVLGSLWSDNGTAEVVSFVHGPWDDEALAL